ncbi:MAG: PAS domain S-box protein [Geobacteraceae bacterium]|nr:PAS domain S-box protein [Geobacteraceae bacterium]
MLTQFRDWGIKAKIMSILLVSLCMFTLSVEILFVPLMLRNLMNERQNDAQQVVEVAYGILKEHAQEVQAGLETLDVAQDKAISLIKPLRFKGQEYFWIHDLTRPVPKMIMHPVVPSLDGTVLDDPQFNKASGKRTLSDPAMIPLNNKNLFVAMNEVVDVAGEGFVTYLWPKPKADSGVTTELYPKISFVKKFEPWGWVIGSGIYVDDVNAAVTNLRRLIHIASIFFCLATIIIYYLMLHYISKPVTNLAHLAKRIASGEYGAQLSITTNDEVGLLSESLNRMSCQVNEKTRDLETANRELQQELAEHRRAEESLKSSEERFRTLVNNSFDVIYVLDSRGVFQFVSPSWETHFGYPAGNVIGMEFQHFVHPDDAPLCFEYLTQVMTNGQAATSPSYRVKHADGSWKLFVANGTRHTDSTGTALYIGVGHDISDEKRLEEERLNLERQFLHAQKLESLGIMAGGIAHDFNNLLTVIIGNLELSWVHLDKTSQTANRIDQAMKASLRAADLTRHMLDYTGRGVFRLTPIDLNLLVKENSDLFRTTVPKTITMITETSTSLPPVVGDSGQLQQVIMNLITNAAEAIAGEPGKIVIATGVQECDWKLLQHSKLEMKPPAGRYVYLDVTDSGCGMDEETQQRIFEPFYTTKFTGRGLGMSSVMGIIKSHNGAILLYSEPELGSTFKVLLPIFVDQQGVFPSDPAENVPLKPNLDVAGMVLVVDDEEPVREVCREYLHDMGLLTLGAADGREAVDIFRRNMHDISLVILDLTMPHMDGVASLHELRLLQPGVKILISSGHAVQSTEKMFIDDTPDGFIQKPYQILELKNKISEILHGASCLQT